MLIRFCEAVLLAAFFAAVAYGFGRLIGVVAAGMIKQSGNLDAIQVTIARRSGLEREFAGRVGERRRIMAGLDRDIKELVRKRVQLEQMAAEALETPDRILRQIGQEIRGARLYLALVLNKVKTQKLVACLADLGGCDTVTRGPSNSGLVENLFGYDAAPEFPRSDWAVCR